MADNKIESFLFDVSSLSKLDYESRSTMLVVKRGKHEIGITVANDQEGVEFHVIDRGNKKELKTVLPFVKLVEYIKDYMNVDDKSTDDTPKPKVKRKRKVAVKKKKVTKKK